MRRHLAAVLVLAACSPPGPRIETPLKPTPVLVDQNADPAIVEVQLVAALGTTEYLPGKPAEIWGYRDGAVPGSVVTVPGPMLVANQGDLVIVHFKNDLPEHTTVHWHGLRLPPAADGSPSTQSPVLPGQSFEYRFVAKDSGSFWFHPHMHGDIQIEAGLYAPMIVHGGTTPEVAADRYFVLDDVKVEASGKLSTATDSLDIMMGRQGNVVLVNGQKLPGLTVAAGSRERWRLVNSANGRFFNLELPGHTFLVIGTDGGLLPEPYETTQLLIAPGERYEVLVTLTGETGAGLFLRTVFYDRGHNMPDPGPKDILQLQLGPRGAAPAPLPTTWRTLEPLATVDVTTPVRRFVLKEFESADGVRFFINDEFWPFNNPVVVKEGETEIWEIENDSEMDHPFHLHGHFFEVVSRNGVAETRKAWKDTVNVPTRSKVQFSVRYGPLGKWMFHCHILEHAERGMMGDLMVEP